MDFAGRLSKFLVFLKNMTLNFLTIFFVCNRDCPLGDTWLVIDLHSSFDFKEFSQEFNILFPHCEDHSINCVLISVVDFLLVDGNFQIINIVYTGPYLPFNVLSL